MKLLISGITKFVLGLLFVGLLVFLPAGTFHYINGWIFMSVLFVLILILGIFLWLKSPNLLKKRLDSKEKDNSQKVVVLASALIFSLGFIIAGLDFRFGWSTVPLIISILSVCVFILSYLMYAEVMRENTYLSRKIEVVENQKVVDTGLYGVVRHPMYAATILMFLMIPLILGSWWSFVIFITYPIIIVVRINNEEKTLSEQLNGYTEYKQKVKYKIIPFLW